MKARIKSTGVLVDVTPQLNINPQHSNHYDDKIDDIAKDWQLPRYELVKKVLNELNKK